MKSRFLFWGSIGVISVSCFMCSFLPGNNPAKDKTLVTENALMSVLQMAHYNPRAVDDKLSADVYDLYLKRIDLNKKFLLQSDVDQLKEMRTKIDDQLKEGNFEFFNLSTRLLNARYAEVGGFYKELLSTPFDYTIDEKIETEPKKLTYATDEKQLKEEWRKLLKYQTIIRLAESLDAQDRAKEKKDTVVELKSMEELDKDARRKVEKSYDDFFKRLKKIDDNDRLGMYLNAVANVYDPHTEFFPPKVKDNFDIAMSGQLEGIGAQLQEKDGVIKVSNIVPGSASWKQGQLKAGDIIMKVAQGKEEPVDIADMRIDDAVQLIRGKKGTEVRLTVKKPDASTIIIPIIRDIVILDETYAKSVIIDEKTKIGYIKLPSFYADFNKVGGRHCAVDVKNELIKLKEQNVQGIILDLRYNGGGSLSDVVDMVGLFIDKGPVVQVKTTNPMVEVLEDKNPGTLFDGPLVVMVNNNSASASEIMAAAIQDYKRGIVLGGEQTFGKGTVQRVLNLDDRLDFTEREMAPIGSLKLTMQKFYRVNGGSTQLKGVASDIVVPDRYEKLYKGEREEDFPMPWDEIKSATINEWKPIWNINDVKRKSAERINSSSVFSQIKGLENKYEEQSKKTLISLNLEKYRQEQKKNTVESDSIDKMEKELSPLNLISLPQDIERLQGDSAKTAMNKEWLKNVKKDSYIKEAVNVINDMK